MAASRHREEIRRRLAAGQRPGEIAAALGVARSTVWRAGMKRGRRKGEAAAVRVVAARLSEREGRALDAMVGALSGAGVMETPGGAIRKLVRRAAGFYVPDPDEAAYLREAERHLARLGGNFNQIAGALSASMRKIGRTEAGAAQVATMHAAADEVGEIRHVVRQMLTASQTRCAALRAELDALDGDDAPGDAVASAGKTAGSEDGR